MVKKVIIIGAGIAGLSAGIYARLNGYDVQIFEAHTAPGGLCTAWHRQGYTFDGCLHWLTGSAPGSALYRVWEDLGAVQDRPMYNHSVAARFVSREGQTVHLYADVDRLEQHLLELSPEDAPAIRELGGAVRRLARLQVPVGKPGELMGPLDGIRMALAFGPLMKDLTTYQNLTLGQIGARFRSPLLRAAISTMMFDPTQPAIGLVSTLGLLGRQAGGVPLGGSLAFARAIEARYLSLGGRVIYRSPVAAILNEGGRTTGVRLADGAELAADAVISASDMRATLFNLLDGTRVHPIHRDLLEHGKRFPSSALVTFGVDMDFSDEISCLGTNYELAAPLALADGALSVFSLHNFSYDPSLAPAGKSVVQSIVPADYATWERLAADRPAYLAAKQALERTCREQIERIHPGFGAKVEASDVATPVTFARYTGNWQGTYMTWALSMDWMRKNHYIPKTVPGLKGCYLASMWTNAPGGLPSAAMAGREVVQLLCHEDRQRFVTGR